MSAKSNDAAVVAAGVIEQKHLQAWCGTAVICFVNFGGTESQLMMQTEVILVHERVGVGGGGGLGAERHLDAAGAPGCEDWQRKQGNTGEMVCHKVKLPAEGAGWGQLRHHHYHYQYK